MQSVAPQFSFACEVRPDRDRVILEVAGELDLAEAPAVEAAFTELLDAGFDRIVVDLRALTFLDSSGLRTLLDARRDAQERGAEISLVRGPRQVQRLLELTGTETMFRFAEARTLR